MFVQRCCEKRPVCFITSMTLLPKTTSFGTKVKLDKSDLLFYQNAFHCCRTWPKFENLAFTGSTFVQQSNTKRPENQIYARRSYLCPANLDQKDQHFNQDYQFWDTSALTDITTTCFRDVWLRYWLKLPGYGTNIVTDCSIQTFLPTWRKMTKEIYHK